MWLAQLGSRSWVSTQHRFSRHASTNQPRGLLLAPFLVLASSSSITNESDTSKCEDPSMTASPTGDTQAQDGTPPPSIRRSSTKLRRANTKLTKFDTVLQNYEYRLRENASLEKIFKYFTSIVVNGRDYMTPLDMVRSITPGVPPSPSSSPLNVPLHQSQVSELGHFSEKEIPPFFKLAKDDPGLVSYGRFLIYVTLLAIPANELETAYRMSVGYDFKMEFLRGDRLGVHNFDFIMQRNVKCRGQGYSTEHSKKSFVRYLFGKDLNGTLSFEQFQKFHKDLRNEVLKMEYFLLSDRESENGEPVMSLPAFARSVAALVPSDYRAEFLQRARQMADDEIPAGVFKHGVKRKCRDCVVTLEDYSNWKEVLKQLHEMEHAIRKYSYADGHFSPTNFKRSARAVAHVHLSKKMVWCLFYLFDKNGNGELHHDDFVKLLQPHASSTNPTIEPEGLGLNHLVGCMKKACGDCYRAWFDGTMEPSQEEEEE